MKFRGGVRTMTWQKFWNSDHSIYVNARHRKLHDQLVAREAARLIPSHDCTMLDYGCGESTAADDLSCRCRKLLLFDVAPRVRSALTNRYKGHPKIEVLSPKQVQALPPASLDIIVVNSVLQYITRAELYALLAVFRLLLNDRGT